jgi:hypothetical protein
MIVLDELERTGEEAVVVEDCTGIHLERLKKITKNVRTDSVPTEIRTGHLPNTSLTHYRSIHLGRWS